MNLDITFEKNDYVFNYRVAIVIRKDNFILIQKDYRVNHITLPGGRCSLGEDTRKAAIREFKEETDIDCEFKKDLGIIENFFTSSFNGKKYHEILFMLELGFVNNIFYEKEVINNIEEKKKEYLKYIWIEIDKLKKVNFKPEVVLKMIDSKELMHEISG